MTSLYFVSALLLLSILSESTARPDARVIGGKEAFAGQFPGAAAIYVSKLNGTYFCGGVMVSPNHFVTTASCIYGSYRFDITVGTNDLTGTNPNRVVISTALNLVHHTWNRTSGDGDIAVIESRRPVELSDYIQPINLPTKEISDSEEVTVIGWGQTSDAVGGLAPNLNYVPVVTIDNEECQSSYNSPLTENMMCAIGGYNEGACNGDAGGPLIAGTGNQQTLVGIASFISNRGCETVDPSGFTRIFPYVDWIKYHAGLTDEV